MGRVYAVLSPLRNDLGIRGSGQESGASGPPGSEPLSEDAPAVPAAFEELPVEFALWLVALAVFLVPLSLRVARRLAGEQGPGPGAAAAPWGWPGALAAVGMGFAAVVAVGLVPGAGLLAVFLRTLLVQAVVLGACVAAVRQTGLTVSGALGLAAGGAWPVLGGSLACLLLEPVLLGAVVLWPLLARRMGIELEPQAVLELILAAPSPRALWLAAGLAVLAVPLLEEIVFRGFLQPVLVRDLGPPAGVVLTSAAFALLHGASAAGPIFLLSLFLGWLRQTSGSVVTCWAAHATHNGLTLALALAWMR